MQTAIDCNGDSKNNSNCASITKTTTTTKTPKIQKITEQCNAEFMSNQPTSVTQSQAPLITMDTNVLRHRIQQTMTTKDTTNYNYDNMISHKNGNSSHHHQQQQQQQQQQHFDAAEYLGSNVEQMSATPKPSPQTSPSKLAKDNKEQITIAADANLITTNKSTTPIFNVSTAVTTKITTNPTITTSTAATAANVTSAATYTAPKNVNATALNVENIKQQKNNSSNSSSNSTSTSNSATSSVIASPILARNGNAKITLKTNDNNYISNNNIKNGDVICTDNIRNDDIVKELHNKDDNTHNNSPIKMKTSKSASLTAFDEKYLSIYGAITDVTTPLTTISNTSQHLSSSSSLSSSSTPIAASSSKASRALTATCSTSSSSPKALKTTSASNTLTANMATTTTATTTTTKTKTATKSELLHWNDMPQYLQFNPYVLEGYRPLQTFKGCLLSLFYWHNETINILTHAIPIVYILAIVPGLMPWEKDYRFLSFCHVFGSVAPWCGSFVYHLFMNIEKGENVYYRLLKLDMVGIWVSQSFGAMPLVIATTFCFSRKWKWFFIISYIIFSFWGLYKALTAASPWQRRLCFALPFTMRSILTFLRTMGHVGGSRVALSHVYLQDGVSILGGAIGAMRIPEKWFPGLVDFYLNSHNIMHVLVVVAVYSMHKATIKDFEWMAATNCEAFKNSTTEVIESTLFAHSEL